ncbi:hypothetical protein APHAL10511_003527 [Amanita phalloides]|nr:hypothetical protein APHAL10511_003527 [Amanita phalloides]
MSVSRREPYDGIQRKLRAQAFLTDKLRESQFGKPEDIGVMTKYFDKTTKPSFKGSSKPYFIRFGRSENDPQFEIRSGSVKISGSQIADFFEPAVQGIIHVIEEQSRQSALPINTVFMVGGFATSDYLFSKLREHFNPNNMSILRPDAYLNKAVAEGAVSFNVNHSVTSRVARYTYGAKCSFRFDANNPDHIERQHTCYEALDGRIYVPKGFSPILIKNTEVTEEKEFRQRYSKIYTELQFNQLAIKSKSIICYRNHRRDAPAWVDVEPDLFPVVCEVTADLSEVKKSIRSRMNYVTGVEYFKLEYDAILLFGLAELKAQIAWIENGEEKRGPASIVYDISSTARL